MEFTNKQVGKRKSVTVSMYESTYDLFVQLGRTKNRSPHDLARLLIAIGLDTDEVGESDLAKRIASEGGR